jgi:hypothetical protein
MAIINFHPDDNNVTEELNDLELDASTISTLDRSSDSSSINIDLENDNNTINN